MRVTRLIVLVVGVLAAAGCGRVSSKVDAGADPDTGSGGGSACVTNDECAAPTPYCGPGGECVACLEAAHCPAEQPVCDSTSHECRACTTDADCDSALCDVSSGQCVAEAEILYVTPNGPDSGTCSKSQPCSITHANAIAASPRHTIKLAPGAYTASISITAGKTLIIHGVGATISAPVSSFVFQVENGARLRVVGATLIAASTVTVVRCEDATSGTPVLELFRATLNNSSSVVIANPCMLTVEESVIRNTDAGSYFVVLIAPTVAKFHRTRFIGVASGTGIFSTGGSIQIANSVLENVGSPGKRGSFIGGNFDVSFSTIVDSGIECSSSGATGLTLNSSIVVNTRADAPADTLVDVTACTSVRHSVVFPQSAALGGTNVAEMPQFKNPAADDFHLLSTSPAIDRGDPTSTNAVDFDGTPRPQGSARDSGAFEYKP